MARSPALLRLSCFLLTSSWCALAAEAPVVRDKTLVAWVSPANLTQRGGSALTLDDQAGHFDGIVFGELAAGKWMAGSDHWRRSQREQKDYPVETAGPDTLVQIAIVYQGKQVTVFRNARAHARYEIAEPQAFGPGMAVVMGLRHLEAGDKACFAGSIDDARIYGSALDEKILAALEPNQPSDPKPLAWWNFEEGRATDVVQRFPEGKLIGGARIAGGRLILDGKDGSLVTPPAACPRLPAAIPHYDSPIHYRPKAGVLADTIPFFWKGEYHVFYLRGGVGKVPWEHLVSTDLVHWRELATALSPDPRDPEGPDGHHMFTGSVIEHGNRFHIFYTGHNPRNPKGMEHVCHATSPDLIQWTKHPEHAFGADNVHYKAKSDFRDPFVFWNEQEQCWWMLLCAREAQTGKPVQGVARSRDLVAWEQLAPLAFEPPLAGGTPECPDLFKSGDTWYLLHSPCAGTTDVRYAKDLRGSWRRPDPFPIDTSILYAAKRMFDGKRHILTGWIRDLNGNTDRGGGSWGGTQSLPREAYEGPGGQLYFKPVDEVPAVFTRLHYEGKPGVEAGGRWSLDVPDHYMLDFVARLEARTALVLLMRQQPGGEAYRLTLQPFKRQAELAGSGFASKRTCHVDTSKPVRIQAFVQGTIIECFINSQYAYSWRAYNLPHGKLGLEANGGPVQVESLRVMLAP